MNFSEYFNALHPYLSGGEKPTVFFDSMIGHFVYSEAEETCKLLNCQADTKSRYIRIKNPNKIKQEFAQDAFSQHNPERYKEWLNDRMFQLDTYDRIEEWLNENKIEFNDVCVACDNLLESILFKIGHPNVQDKSDVNLPKKNSTDNADSLQIIENDRALLRDFCIDYDSILEKCITNNQSEIWFTGRMSKKINHLYNDIWKDKLEEFKDLRIQADVLNTIATLREFSDALDPDNDSSTTLPVRKLREKLRGCYIKIHPDEYVDLLPYEAVIDDWNDFNDPFEV